MTLRATLPHRVADKPSEKVSKGYNHHGRNLDDERNREEDDLQNETEDEGVDGKENCECHDYLHLMVMDMFLKLEYL